jgi:excisionase family DNA binding protein
MVRSPKESVPARSSQIPRFTQLFRKSAEKRLVTDGNGRKAYLRAAEAAALLHVSPKTISRWAREGKLGHVVTLGGHRRFSREDIEALAGRLAHESESFEHHA